MPELSPSMLSRRALLAAFGAAGAGAALAGCGAPGGGATATGATSSLKQADMDVPSKYQGRTQVLFWSPWTSSAQAAIKQMCSDFNESQSDIFVGTESQNSYQDLNQKFSAALQAQAVPDIVCFPELQWLQFYFNDAFVSFDDYMTDDWNLDIFIQAFVGEGVAEGKTYVMPFARSNPLFYFNRDLYRQAGLPEEGPKTWPELAEFAPELAKIKVKGKPVQAFAFGPTDNWYGQSHVWAWGGNFSRDFDVTFDEEQAVEWLEWKRKFIHDDKFAHMAQSAHTDFTTGLVAGTHGSTASLTALTAESKFDVGAAFMLGYDEAEPNVPTGGSGLSVVKGDSKDRQDAAVEFCKYLAEPEVCAFWHEATGYLPIVTAAQQTDTVQDLVKADPNYGVALEQLPNAKTADMLTWFQAGTTDISVAMASVYGDGTPAKDAIASVLPTLEQVMEDNREDLEQVLASS
jgi:sn-glycerol 3-phosphate transport system substrate-binding protein